MKFIFKFRSLALLTVAVFIVILFSECDKNDNNKKCCEENTAKVSGPDAERLVKQCHFIPEDSIVNWTDRYQRSKKERFAGILPDIGTLIGDSSSFRSCIIKKILCDENCIGLRIVYGMSQDKRIHVMIVGIQPDYSTLYIKEPEECCNSNTKQLQNAPGAASATKVGGAEYGQMP